MPFHLGKHKPVAPVKRAAFTLKLRLQAAAMGAFVVILGMFRLSHGVISVVNFYAMPVASGAVVAFGCVLLLFSVIPAAGFLLTGVGLIFYPLSEARMKKLQGELQARQATGGAAQKA